MEWFFIAYLCSSLTAMFCIERLKKRIENLEDRYYEILKEVRK